MAPDKKTESRYTNKGAIFTTFGWVLATYIYSYYIGNYAQYDVFYGGLANIIVLMLWFLLLAYIFTIGLAMNHRVEEEELEKTVVAIPYEADEREDAFNQKPDKIAAHIFRSIAENLSEEDKNIYIDYTGGMRDISFLMTAVIQFLEFSGHPCKKIVYSNHFSKLVFYFLPKIFSYMLQTIGNRKEVHILPEVYSNFQKKKKSKYWKILRNNIKRL